MLGGGGQEHRALAEGTAQHTHLVGRPERPGQQAEGMEALDPLAVLHVTCGSALALLHVRRIDEEDREATRLQERKEREPRDSGRCEGDGGAPTGGQPGGAGVQVGGIGAKTAHRLRVITGWNRHKVGCGPDINASGMPVGSCQLRWERGCVGDSPGRFGLASGPGNLHNVGDNG